MKRILLLSAVFLCLLTTGAWAQRTVSGTVSEDNGSTIPGVNVVLKGTSNGTTTDIDGTYRMSIPEEGGILVFSFIGLATQEVEVGSRSVIDVTMQSDVKQLTEVVVTALGIEREERTLTYASQEVNEEQLNITQNTDIKGALAGKVAGVQLNSQAGSKLGEFGKIRIRGAMSLTDDNDPLYVIDGIPTTDPNSVDMNNVASINVLKGPNATALYGQRADAGVVVITTKKGNSGLNVEFYNSTTWDKVAFLPEYQNEYGRGYDGEASFATFDYDAGGFGGAFPSMWSQFDGKRYIYADNNYADESWGPKFDGEEYVPWYAWWPDSPYYGQTAKYEARPDNVKNFYNTGVTMKNTLTVSGGGDKATALLSYSKLNQSGITPYTTYDKDYVTGNFSYDVTDKLSVTTNIRYATSTRHGDFDDGYGNQTSGSFNSWFARETNSGILEELKDLKTPDGHSASWNWWGPDYYTLGGGYKKAAFWFNPYTFMDQIDRNRYENDLVGSIAANYSILDNLDLNIMASRNSKERKEEYFLPFFLSNSSAPELYNSWSNSFGKYRRTTVEDNFIGSLTYNERFGEVDVKGLVGANYRHNTYDRFSAQMPIGAKTGGLIIPNVYTFSNAGNVPTPSTYLYEKKVMSIYGNLSVGYKDFLYLDAAIRKDWSSALPANNNGYAYPSIGLSLIFSELAPIDFLSYGKLRASWAQVGSDVDALLINPTYGAGSQAFQSQYVIQYTPTRVVDPKIKPSLNTSLESGLDLRFMEGRIGFSATVYRESRVDDIVPISISRGSGYNDYLTNAGEVLRRGVELSLDADLFKSNSGFNWNLMVNFARNRTTIESLPGDLDAIGGYQSQGNAFGFVSVVHKLDEEWGQLRGTGFATDDNGNRILNANGLYVTESNKFLGGVLPDFTGGIINSFSYKGFSLIASIDYQKGGKFFSLSESWGTYSGLYEETAGTNDKGNPKRDAVDDGGGVHVTGVDANGETVDTYVEALSYYGQFYGNRLAEEFIHDASYVKLREISLSYNFGNLINGKFIKGATVGVVGRNLGFLALAKDNVHNWDPSSLAETYGEDGQLPNTRSYGVNVKLTF